MSNEILTQFLPMFNRSYAIAKAMADDLTNHYTRKKAAWQLKHKVGKKSGSLDMQRIHSYKTSEDIFKKRTIVPEGASHGIIALIDNSGSMSKDIRYVMINAIALALFAKRNKVTFEAYLFTSGQGHGKFIPDGGVDIFPSSLKLIRILDNTMTAESIKNVLFEFMLYNTISEYSEINMKNLFSELYGRSQADMFHRKINDVWSQGGTPLALAYLGAFESAANMVERGIQEVSIFSLTDGQGDDSLMRTDMKPLTQIIVPHNGEIYSLEDYKKVNDAGYFRANESYIRMINAMANDMDIMTNHLYLCSDIHRSIYHEYNAQIQFTKTIGQGKDLHGYKRVTLVKNSLSTEPVLNFKMDKDRLLAQMAEAAELKNAQKALANEIVNSICRYYLK